jgi:hypothetical protein
VQHAHTRPPEPAFRPLAELPALLFNVVVQVVGRKKLATLIAAELVGIDEFEM